MNIINLKQIERTDSLRLRKIGEQYYLFDNSKCFQVNMTGAIIVNALGRDLSIDDLSEKLAQRFSCDMIDNIKTDIYVFINFLIDEKLVTIK